MCVCTYVYKGMRSPPQPFCPESTGRLIRNGRACARWCDEWRWASLYRVACWLETVAATGVSPQLTGPRPACVVVLLSAFGRGRPRSAHRRESPLTAERPRAPPLGLVRQLRPPPSLALDRRSSRRFLWATSQRSCIAIGCSRPGVKARWRMPDSLRLPDTWAACTKPMGTCQAA